MKIFNILIILLFITVLSNTRQQSANWPVLKTYKGENLKRIAMPVGGIGTGTISLTGNGALHDWEIMSSPAKGFNAMIPEGPPVNRAAFFAINIKEEQKTATCILLEGSISDGDYEGDMGAVATNHGLPRFSEST